MPKLDRRNLLTTRLAEGDMIRFRELAQANKTTYSELLREAALFYMDHYDQAKRDEMEGVYAQQLKGSTNRICGLMAKTAIEVHAILEVLRRVDGGDELVKDAMSVASKRLNKGLEKEEQKIREQMTNIVSAEGGKAS
jgi:hypothetical protein